MKYSKRFERDYDFYIKNLDFFDFCGKKDSEFVDKNGNSLVVFDDDGVSAKEAFYGYESFGKILKTKEADLLLRLHKCKASINLHIEMWSEGRAEGTLPRIEFDTFAKASGFLKWIVKAVESQKWKVLEKKYGKGFGVKQMIDYEKRWNL